MAEKYRQRQAHWICLLIASLCLLTTLDSVSEQPQTVWVFVDRTALKKGETLSLVVQCETPYTLPSEPDILLHDSFSISKSGSNSDLKKEYIIKANKAGKYNIQVSITYKMASEGARTMIREIKDIHVQKSGDLDWKTLLGPLQVVVGALLAFAASLGMWFLNSRTERRKKRDWVFDSLLPQLRIAKQNIERGERVKYEKWMDEFYEGGYYSALQNVAGRLEGKPDLCGDIVTIHGLLKRYEQELEKVTISENLREELNQNMSGVIEKLSEY